MGNKRATTCGFCNKDFDSREDAMRHIIATHPEKMVRE